MIEIINTIIEEISKESNFTEDPNPHNLMEPMKKGSSRNKKFTLLGEYLNEAFLKKTNIKVEETIKWVLFFFEYPEKPFGSYKKTPWKTRNWISIVKKNQNDLNKNFENAFFKVFEKLRTSYVPSVLQDKLTKKNVHFVTKPWLIWPELAENKADIKLYCPKKKHDNFKIICLIPHFSKMRTYVCQCQTYEPEEPKKIIDLASILGENSEEVFKKTTQLNSVLPFKYDNKPNNFSYYLRLPIMHQMNNNFITEAHIALPKNLAILNHLSLLKIFLYGITAITNNHIAFFIGEKYGIQKNQTLNEIKKTEKIKKYFIETKKIIGTLAYKDFISRSIRDVNLNNKNCIIKGEKGTGKEFIVSMIHKQKGQESSIPFVTWNSVNPIKDLLFPNEKNVSKTVLNTKFKRKSLLDKKGLKTLFIFDIDKLSKNDQKLLINKLDTNKKKIRILGTTTQDIDLLINKGLFSKSLYEKINQSNIKCKPLRENRGNILEFTKYFVDHFSIKFSKKKITVPTEIYDILYNYTWPENIDELKTIISTAIIQNKTGILNSEDLGFYLTKDYNNSDAVFFRCSLTGVLINKKDSLLANKILNKIHKGELKKIKPSFLYPKGPSFKKNAAKYGLDTSIEFALAFFYLWYSIYWTNHGKKEKNLTEVKKIFTVVSIDSISQKFRKLIDQSAKSNGIIHQHLNINSIVNKYCLPFKSWLNQNKINDNK